jgi:hypothetical protein
LRVVLEKETQPETTNPTATRTPSDIDLIQSPLSIAAVAAATSQARAKATPWHKMKSSTAATERMKRFPSEGKLLGFHSTSPTAAVAGW